MTYTPATDLPTGQKMALLVIRSNTLADQILEHLREMSAPEPGEADVAELISQSRVTLRNGVSVLTPGGLYSVSDIMRDYARKFGIHDVSYGGANGNHGPSARCTCGWGTYQPNNRSAVLTLSRYAAQHLQQAKAGTLPEAYRLPKFEAMEAKAS